MTSAKGARSRLWPSQREHSTVDRRRSAGEAPGPRRPRSTGPSARPGRSSRSRPPDRPPIRPAPRMGRLGLPALVSTRASAGTSATSGRARPGVGRTIGSAASERRRPADPGARRPRGDDRTSPCRGGHPEDAGRPRGPSPAPPGDRAALRVRAPTPAGPETASTQKAGPAGIRPPPRAAAATRAPRAGPKSRPGRLAQVPPRSRLQVDPKGTVPPPR